MQSDKIQCPQCDNVITDLSSVIHKADGKNYLQERCPKCGYVFRQKESWSQGARIIAIVIFIPLAMFFTVFFTVFLRDALFMPNLPFIVFPIALVAIGFFIRFYFAYKGKNNLRDILRKDFEKYKFHREAGAPGNEEEIEFKPSKDPLMDKIRLDMHEKLKEKAPNNEKKKSMSAYFLSGLTVALISAFAVFSLLPDIIKLLNEHEKSRNELSEMLIESEAQNIMSMLHNLYGENYPKELPPSIYSLFNMPSLAENDMDKEYFGETLGIEDFTYTGYGSSFRLCIKPSLGGKCWER